MPGPLDFLNPDNSGKNLRDLAAELKRQADSKKSTSTSNPKPTTKQPTNQSPSNNNSSTSNSGRDNRNSSQESTQTNNSSSSGNSNSTSNNNNNNSSSPLEDYYANRANRNRTPKDRADVPKEEPRNRPNLSDDSDPNLLNPEDETLINDLIQKSGSSNQGFVLPDKLPETGAHENLNILDFAHLSDASYGDESNQVIPDGFSSMDLRDRFPELFKEFDTVGYQMEGYVNYNTNEIIISHRGSDDWMDWGGNLSVVLADRYHSQLDYAIELFNQLGNDYGNNFQFTHTGHSLGGYLAEVIAQETRSYAITFDPLHADNLLTKKFIAENLTRVTPQGLGVYKLTKDIANLGLENGLSENSIYYDGSSKFSSIIKSGWKGATLGHNHKLGNIIKGIKKDKVDILNPLANDVLMKSSFFSRLFRN